MLTVTYYGKPSPASPSIRVVNGTRVDATVVWVFFLPTKRQARTYWAYWHDAIIQAGKGPSEAALARKVIQRRNVTYVSATPTYRALPAPLVAVVDACLTE
jgi:hypothetical protein